MKYFAQITLAALLFSAVFVGTWRTASAQDTGQKIIKEVDLNQTDIRQAIQDLFKKQGLSYTLAPEVQGTVTVLLRNVTFEIALQNILRQVDATYRIADGVYQIVSKTDYVGPRLFEQETPRQDFVSPASPSPQVTASTMTVDGRYLYVAVGSEIYKMDKEDMNVVKIGSLQVLHHIDVREALKKMFRDVNVSYSIRPEVHGYVDLRMQNVTFETALQSVLRQVGATYRIEAGVYEIVKASTKPVF